MTEPRFAFGTNWRHYMRQVDDARIATAERALQSALGLPVLRDRTVLDVGSGSGLFSLAATRLGAAKVHSFDLDPISIDCTRALKQRYAPDAETWTVELGDVTDERYCAAIGRFDAVYCFGVVHHTGAMWRALENVVGRVAPGGRLFVSVYNDQGRTSARWRAVKRFYHRLPARAQPLYAAAVWAPFELRQAIAGTLREPRAYLRTWTDRERGMSRWHDIVDWVGGYPFEVAMPAEVFDHCHRLGLQLERLRTVGASLACNEFLFSRPAEVTP